MLRLSAVSQGRCFNRALQLTLLSLELCTSFKLSFGDSVTCCMLRIHSAALVFAWFAYRCCTVLR